MYLDFTGIENYIKSFEKDTKALKEELFRICWYMRGGVTADQSFMLSHEDRIIIGKIIQDNLNTTKETQMPFF